MSASADADSNLHLKVARSGLSQKPQLSRLNVGSDEKEAGVYKLFAALLG